MAGRLRSSPSVLWVWPLSTGSKHVLKYIGSFLPITLEQLARDRGVLLSDKITPCISFGELPAGNSTAFSRPHKHDELPACVVYIGNIEINTTSFAMYTFSLSVLVQALLIISMSGAADHGKFRKKFLLTFAYRRLRHDVLSRDHIETVPFGCVVGNRC